MTLLPPDPYPSLAWLQERAVAPLAPSELDAAAKVAGLQFTAAEVLQMQRMVSENLAGYARLQALALPSELEAPLVFTPLLPGQAPVKSKLALTAWSYEAQRPLPSNQEDIAFASVLELAAWIKSRQISCVELTQLYLERCRRLDPQLRCVVNLLDTQALAEAEALDRELDAGHWRGPLHGIPYGAKDLLAARGAPTTWGSAIYEERVIDADATVITKLRQAGAVLLCKTSLGEFAYGDLWHGGRTRNPWDTSTGSSGSSAGSAAAVACAALPFAVGSETLGSIVSPSTTCGATGLRPTYGRVSRHGAMSLSWTMDKLGPIARTAADCALVLDVLRGTDGLDGSVVDAPYAVGSVATLDGLRIGVPSGAFDEASGHRHVLDELRSLGATLVDVDVRFDVPLGDVLVVLVAEAAAQFDETTRSNADERMVWQDEAAWPNTFRAARLMPAVEYLRAQRLRTRVMQHMAHLMKDVDLLVHPSFATDLLLATNLTGHPVVCAPDGLDKRGLPRSITFVGQLYGEADLTAASSAWQQRYGALPRPPVR